MLAEIFLLPKDFSRVVENLSCLYFEIITMSKNSASIISRTIAHRDFFDHFIIYLFNDNVRCCKFS